MIPKEIRHKAKLNNKFIITLGICGQYARADSFEATFCATKEEADLVWALYDQIKRLRKESDAKGQTP